MSLIPINRLSRSTGNLLRPQYLFLQLNQRCNLRCRHCNYWKLDDKDKPHYLSRERKEEIMTEFAGFSTNGTVVICGGESMLDKEDYFHITTTCRKIGLRCLSVINGTRIHTNEVAERMLIEGPHEITLSVDSCRENDHDLARGLKGSFQTVIRAIKLLLNARERLNLSNKIFAMTILHELNYRYLDEFYNFILNEVGADKLKLNIIQPTFGFQYPDNFYDANVIRDVDGLVNIINHCNDKYKLNIDPEWTRQVTMYFHSINELGNVKKGWAVKKGTRETICNSYDRNIMIDLYGNAKLCFSPHFPSRSIEKPGDLKTFWEKAHWRDEMRQCTRFCGISHSVRKTPCTLV